MNYLLVFLFSVFLISCKEKPEEKNQGISALFKNSTNSEYNLQKEYVDPIETMTKEEIYEYDSLFNFNFTNKFQPWHSKIEDSLDCKIVYHSDRGGYAFAINFLNISDSTISDENLDKLIRDIPNYLFSNLDSQVVFIYSYKRINFNLSGQYKLRY
jgi:hypothetical protein